MTAKTRWRSLSGVPTFTSGLITAIVVSALIYVMAFNYGGCVGNSSSGGNVIQCLLPESKILIEDNKSVNIKDIKVGDKLIGFDEKTSQTKLVKVIKVFKHKNKEGYYRIFLENNWQLEITGNHPVYIASDICKKADNLEAGYTLFTECGLIKIVKIEFIPKSSVVYNLEVSDTHNYFANGILVHNKPAPLPSIATNPATNITGNSATLNGRVYPSIYGTNIYFEYGISTTPITYPISTTSQAISGTNGLDVNYYVAVTSTINGLLSNTQYNFRLNGSFVLTYGNNLTFTTEVPAAEPPAVDDYVWVANWDSAYVTRIKKSDSTTTTIAVESNPQGVAVDANYVWVANDGSNTVTRILKADLNTTTIAVGNQPSGIAVDGTYCWVANWGSDNVSRILKADSTTTTIAVGNNPFGVAVDSNYVWVTNQGSNTVTRIKKSDSTTTTIAMGGNPLGVAVDWTYCWVANWDFGNGNTVTRILKADSTTTTITVGSLPIGTDGVAVDETYCWVVNDRSSNVIRILKSDLSTINIAVGSGSIGVAVDWTYCWVPIGSGVIRIRKSDSATTNITVGSGLISLGDMTGYAYDNYARVP
ncbi:MAG: polymorphic toxin-type HINT domain-containing protein [Planctomycetota bacterium]